MIFDSIKIKIDQTTKTIPTLKAIAVYLCGHIGLAKEEESADKWIIAGYEPSVGRKVFCKQLPNPLEQETWETDGILERLVP